jgi:hypothetical protein
MKPHGLEFVDANFKNLDTKRGEIWEIPADPWKHLVYDEHRFPPGRWQISVYTLKGRLLGRSPVFIVKND